MKLKSISFENYKAFAEKQTLELKPITILIGKNSSGKSAIAKLFTLLENSLSGNIQEPLLLKNNGVELGGEFSDLFFDKLPIFPITFSLHFDQGATIEVSLVEITGKYGLHIFKWSYIHDDISLSIFSSEKGYVDDSGIEYECEFRGILPVKMQPKHGKAPSINIDCNINVDYIGPFRILPERQFYLTGQIDYQKTGVKGENAYYMLATSKLTKTTLHEKVSDWYNEHFDGWALKVEDKNRPFIQVVLSKNKSFSETNNLIHQGSLDINIVDVGQGMNQVLPLVVRANVSKPDSIVVLEQPELHLHPAAHVDLAELFARSAKEHNQKFLIETHSENILLRLRRLIVDNDFGLTKDDVIIYWIEDHETSGKELREITINEEGVLSDWPEGVFNEDVAEIFSMRKALKNKKTQNSDDNKV